MTINLKRIILLSIFIFTSIFCYSLSARAEENAKVITVKMTVNKGDIINKSNLKFIDYNRSKVPHALITNMNEAVGLEALRNIRPGMQLRFTYLREKPMVGKNKIVKVVYNVPGIKLESEAQALQDGQKNDVIKVKNIASNKILTAKVIAENTVQVNK